MGGDDHRRLGVVVADDGGEDVVPGGRVHAADGLIQEIQLCLTAHDHNELHLLPGALAHLLHPLVGPNVQVLEHLLRRVPAEVGIEVAVEVQQLPGGHPGGDAGALRQVAHKAVGCPARGGAADEDLSLAGGQQAVGQLDEGGLAAAVGAQQPHNPARLDGKAHLLQGWDFAVVLAQAVTLQD